MGISYTYEEPETGMKPSVGGALGELSAEYQDMKSDVVVSHVGLKYALATKNWQIVEDVISLLEPYTEKEGTL